MELEGGWQVSDAETPNFGVDASAYWFQRTISVLDPDSSYLLEIACPALDDINLYFVRVKVVIGHYETGDRQVFSSRLLAHWNFHFPIPDEAKTGKMLLDQALYEDKRAVDIV